MVLTRSLLAAAMATVAPVPRALIVPRAGASGAHTRPSVAASRRSPALIVRPTVAEPAAEPAPVRRRARSRPATGARAAPRAVLQEPPSSVGLSNRAGVPGVAGARPPPVGTRERRRRVPSPVAAEVVETPPRVLDAAITPDATVLRARHTRTATGRIEAWAIGAEVAPRSGVAVGLRPPGRPDVGLAPITRAPPPRAVGLAAPPTRVVGRVPLGPRGRVARLRGVLDP